MAILNRYNLIKNLSEKCPDALLSLIKSTDPSFRYRIFMDYIEEVDDDYLKYLAVEIEVQKERREKNLLTNKK